MPRRDRCARPASLLDLLNRRTRIVEDIGRAKEALELPIYEPKREDDVFRNVIVAQSRDR